MQNVAATVLAQYAASPRLNALINSFNAALSPDSFINDFYDLIWNIDTAEKYGLDVWGKIVGVSRRLTVKDDFNYLGFSEARMDNPVMDDPRPFNQAPFYSGKAVIGPHGHAVTVDADGNAETTVKNIAFNYIVRLA